MKIQGYAGLTLPHRTWISTALWISARIHTVSDCALNAPFASFSFLDIDECISMLTAR